MAQFVNVLERVHHYQCISLATEKLFKKTISSFPLKTMLAKFPYLINRKSLNIMKNCFLFPL